MEIPLSSWTDYIALLRQVNDKATELVRKYLEKNSVPQTTEEIDALIRYAYKVSTTLGEASSAAAAKMYDNIAKASKVRVPAAEPAPTPTFGEVAKTVNGMLKNNYSEDAIGSSIGRLVKRTGADTTLHNALRDGAEFAWVPQGDTCAFCIMLASNGWQRASKKTISGDHAEHIHANCDCEFAIRFDSKSGVEGYDPDKYREIYDNAEGDTWEEKLRSMERDEREAHKDEINARKRELYAEKKPQALSTIFVNNKDKLYQNLQNVKPLKKYEDFAIHGVPNQALVEHETTSGIMKRYTPAELADMIRESPNYHGGNVRLLSCGTGADKTGFGQMLADELGKRVIAPTETLWVAENGEMFVSDNDVLVDLWYNNGEINHEIKQTGFWKVFKPNEEK